MRIFGLNRRIIRVLLGSQYAHMLEYRAEIALWALSGVLPFIMLSVWSGSEARTGLGLDGVALDRYFLSAFLVRQFTVVWVVYAFEEDALLGRLSPYLLQPLHPLWRYVAADPFVGSIFSGLVGHMDGLCHCLPVSELDCGPVLLE
jgi:ABC-2 type transport system permease protein